MKEPDVGRFLEGDNAAFEEMILFYKDALIYYLLRYTGSVVAAEEAAEDAFAELYINRSGYDGRSSLKTYLYAVARNKAVDQHRRNRRYAELDEDRADILSLEAQIIRSDEEHQLKAAMSRLKPEYREALHLTVYEEMSYAEAAAVMKKSEGQIKALVFRAKKKLHKILTEEGFVYEN
ncbi:MAG: RNA polymerase sigma factor [Eubacteriales bacterium]